MHNGLTRFTLAVCAALLSACGQDATPPESVQDATRKSEGGPALARRAFSQAASVFFHPRCMNCHPVGDRPLQGDDSHPHAMNVQRGIDGLGRAGMRCTACHQSKNLPGAHMPPGSPVWHLPPEKTPMVFQGMPVGDLCRQMKDPARNGGKTVAEIVEHVSHDKLVLWGWHPGDGRTPVAMPHDEFAAKMTAWANNGAVCPQ